MQRALKRPLHLFLLGALVALGAPTLAQVSAPSLVEEDLPAEEPPASERADPQPQPPANVESVRKPAEARAAPVAVRAIEPVRGRHADLLRAWYERRKALREQDMPLAESREKEILELKAELGIDGLPQFAAAEVRNSSLALEARAPTDALDSAKLAVALAPDLVSAHMALARAHLALEPGRVPADLLAAALSALREPHTVRALEGDLCAAALAAAFAGAALVLALLFLRHLRLLLHDFHHLPVVRMGTPLQASFLGLVLLALPPALRLGPLAILLTLALSAGLYYRSRERAVASLCLVALGLIPCGLEQAVRITAFTGTLADEVYALERGADDGRFAGRLAARAARGELPVPALLSLGRHHKRLGDLDGALRWYEAAGTTRPDALVNVGNVEFLKGNLERARAAYLSAIERATATSDVTALAAAHYDLSKVFLRQSSSLEQAQEARRKAALEDPSFIERYGSDDDFRSNRFLIDVPLRSEEVAALAQDDTPRAVYQAAVAKLAGPLPASSWPYLPLGCALALWPLALLRRGLKVSQACEKCGRPVCRRCGAMIGPWCTQCVNVFAKKGRVDSRDRSRKETQVRWHGRTRRLFARALAIVWAGAGHLWLGEPMRGSLFLFGLLFLAGLCVFWRGVMPSPHPFVLAAPAKLLLVAPLGLLLWAVAIRDLFRRTRG
ncbi:MAG TPA: hypothetical protein VMK12_14075 [Anaeromyxobacteraceae bacterium]|nr:hypothetical protein [Anaeromyxobacteraceae bacterium]